MKRKTSSIALHLACIGRKLANGQPIGFHIEHIAREFGVGPLATRRHAEGAASAQGSR